MKNLAGPLEHAELRTRLKDGNLRIATFGMTEQNLNYHKRVPVAKLDIAVNFDNDKSKWGTKGVLGVEIVPPDRITDFMPEIDAIVVLSEVIDKIGAQLDSLGVERYFWISLIEEEMSGEECTLAEKAVAMVKANGEYVEKARSLLADERSVEIFDAMLAARQSPKSWERFRLASFCRTDDQYFPTDIPSFRLAADEIFVDAGAYTGDAVGQFLKEVNSQYSHIYAFEPDERSFAKLKEFCKDRPNVSSYQAGLYSHNTTLEFMTGPYLTQSTLRPSAENSLMVKSFTIPPMKVEVCALDEILDGGRVSYIKMDIEGAEMAALRGAERSIIAFKPKLAICVYHKITDYWEIPLYLKKIVPGYLLYMRHHTVDVKCYETVLYAVPGRA